MEFKKGEGITLKNNKDRLPIVRTERRKVGLHVLY